MFLNWILLILYYFQLNQNTDAGTFSVDYTNHQFLKDGKPFKYISGSIHYFRVHQDLWDDRLKRIRAMGLNAIQTYAPWNLHEPTQGNFDFSGIVNLTRFLTLAQQNNLYVLFRAGPYIDAEWEYGGLPYWLLKYDNIRMRSSDKNYTNAVANYFNKLMDVIQPFLYKNGGPILMIQIENEYGLINACDRNYTIFLRDLFLNKLGNDIVLYTTNPPYDYSLNCGVVPGTLTTIDFAQGDNAHIDSEWAELDKYSNGGPHVNSEFYTWWFVGWRNQSHNASASESINPSRKDISSNLEYMYHSNASVNMYMVVGGDNFDFWNGAYSNGPIETAYWTLGPIGASGDPSDMYHSIRNMISNLTDWEYPPTPIPANNPTSNYGQVTMTRVGSNLISTLSQILEPCSSSQDPINFEQLDHAYGYVLYSTTLKTGGKTFSSPNIKDAGYVFLNNNYQGMLDSYGGVTTITLSTTAMAGDVLRILVENQGRICGYGGATYPPLELKSLSKGHNNVTLNGVLLQDWIQCGINLTKSSVDSLSQSNFQVSPEILQEKAVSQPGVYFGQFAANPIQDTFFNATGWGKGQLFINGYNLGRYWPTRGPQITLYVPKPFLQAQNTVLLIELTGAQQNSVSFIDHSIFNW